MFSGDHLDKICDLFFILSCASRVQNSFSFHSLQILSGRFVPLSEYGIDLNKFLNVIDSIHLDLLVIEVAIVR
jgi:hypothetical protein